MAHGHIYPAERIDTALGNYFREGNLTALRELALLWVADRVEEGLDRYRAAHGIKSTRAARDRIVVALIGGPEGVFAAAPKRNSRRPSQIVRVGAVEYVVLARRNTSSCRFAVS